MSKMKMYRIYIKGDKQKVPHEVSTDMSARKILQKGIRINGVFVPGRDLMPVLVINDRSHLQELTIGFKAEF